MAMPIAMPRQGNTVESCVIQKWFKKKGEKVREGEVLFSYETDKASFEFESPVSGTLLDVFFGEDDDVPVLTNVAVVGNEGESTAEFRSGAAPQAGGASATVAPERVSGEVAQAPAPQSAAVNMPQSAPGGRIAISPRARRLAQQNGVDTAQLAATGPKGRVIERDVREAIEGGRKFTRAAQSAAQHADSSMVEGTGIGRRITLADLRSAPAAAAPVGAPGGSGDDVTEVKLSNMRRIIGTRMWESLQQAAQLTMDASANASGLLAFRAQVKKQREVLNIADITITDMVVFAVSRTLPKFPQMNALFTDDKTFQYRHAHVALAVDTQRGLMVPVVRCADLLSLNDLALALKDNAAKCHDGSINPDLLSGGTFTVSNLGAFGIESFTPVLNRPQVGLLGVNTIQPRPVATADGQYSMQPHIGLSLTIDHRALDGAEAARFLKALVGAIESINLTMCL